MCFSHPQNLLAGWAGPTVAAGYAKIWDDFAAAWRARKGDDGSQGPRPSLVQWVARQTEDLPEGMRSFARAAQLRRLEIDGGSVMEWDELPEFVKTALEASTYDKMLFDSPLQAYLSLSGLASTTSQGREMLALIAPGESFSDEDARWWCGHVLGTEYGRDGGLASTASQGHDMLAFIAPGESFSEEEARWCKGHILGTEYGRDGGLVSGGAAARSRLRPSPSPTSSLAPPSPNP